MDAGAMTTKTIGTFWALKLMWGLDLYVILIHVGIDGQTSSSHAFKQITTQTSQSTTKLQAETRCFQAV
jgi:hypothetical protein